MKAMCDAKTRAGMPCRRVPQEVRCHEHAYGPLVFRQARRLLL